MVVEDLDLAEELSAATFWSSSQWAVAISDVGGAARARWLIENTGQPISVFTPEVLFYADQAAALLERLPDLKPP